MPGPYSRIRAIDDAMKLGYNWISGPFELMDEIGIQYFVTRLVQEGRLVPAFLLQAAQDEQNRCFYRTHNGQLQHRCWQSADTDNVWHTLDRGNGITRL